MSVCAPCQKTQLIPKCAEVIIVGDIALNNIDVSIYIKDNSTGKLILIPETSDATGIVSFDNDCGLMPDHSYELWVTLDGDNIEDQLEITAINDSYPVIGDTFYCAALRFTDVVDCGGDQQIYATYTIETA